MALRLLMAETVRFKFQAIKALSIFESSNIKSCASSAGVHAWLAGRGPSFISPWPSVRRIATSAEESHSLNSVAPLATILNDVFTFSVGGAFLKRHCLFAYNAVQETYQRAFIVVQ
jgi:hypothetical protein